MSAINTLLIVEDDADLALLLKEKFLKIDWKVCLATTLESGKEALQTSAFSHCLLDLNVDQKSGLELIPQLLEQSPQCKIVVLTGYASVPTSIEAIKLGAVYLLSKPSSVVDILKAFEHMPAPEQVRLDAHAKSGINHHEWTMIQTTLKQNNFNISKTALQLGISRRTLQRKLKKRM